MAYFVAILTPDSTRSCVMQSTFPTKGMRSIISMVSISLEGFLASILLLMVIIVAAVIVTVIRVVVVVVIVGVVIVVAIIRVIVVVMIIGIVVVRIIGIVVAVGGVPFIIKLSFVIIAITFPSMIWGTPPMNASISFSVFGTMFGHKTANSWNILIVSSIPAPAESYWLVSIIDWWRDAFHQDKSIIDQGKFSCPVFPKGLSAFAMAAACASRAAVTPSVISCRMAASVILVAVAEVDVS
ncbi:hypothetical protein Tco_0819565 [Tanacetum coccineum]|uniref:Uncharacterized protein n=1 Tax=Tanacetum coccineum TaxID=301880 RepID=A0ABQ5ABA4_9ASTR